MTHTNCFKENSVQFIAIHIFKLEMPHYREKPLFFGQATQVVISLIWGQNH